MTDHYKTLQVDPEAEAEVIQAAYRRLAQKYHPDVAANAEAAARMSAINGAWEVLGDPGRRAAYDATRQKPSPRSTAGPPPSAGGSARAAAPAGPAPPPQETSPHWTSGRSSFGQGYDPASMRGREGYGAAGPPPGRPAGSVLNFGRYAGWSIGEIGRQDLEYVEWLDRMTIGRPYRDEIDRLLRAAGRRRTADVREPGQRGLFRRR
ncbi:MAG: J domain-containing protein [Chloroflexi bacterium]|nr:J domain-containing protein [Chloroflexota bacterium]